MTHVPRATYRLQLHAGFTFADAERVLGYLAQLGVSHVYSSPIFRARRGSVHGYDITGHRRINEELGGEAGLSSWSRALAAAGLGLVVDFVPNHMGVGYADNHWWLDVLAWGKRSRFAQMFDIDWRPESRALRDKLLLPFLGDHYGAVLDRDELQLRFDEAEGSFSVHYYEHRFPIAPPTYALILREPAVSRDLDALLAELKSIEHPDAAVVLGGRLFERVAELQARLSALSRTDPAVRGAIDRSLSRLGERAPEARRGLHELLETQHYRLAYFRVAADEINYRRFFNINELAGIRVEQPEVFDLTHEKVLALVQDGVVQGLRIDHVDGLFDPGAYCRQLRKEAGRRGRDIYLVVEKILAEHEHLRQDWQVDGTTGYDFVPEVTGLFVDPRGERPLRALYRRQTGEAVELDEATYRAKRETIDTQMSAELQVLANMLDRIAERNTYTRDFTLATLRAALRAIVASFPVYRTYVTQAGGAGEEDRRYIAWAVAQARKRAPSIDASVFDFVERAMQVELGATLTDGHDPLEVSRFAHKLQQYTGPVMAKAVEDTIFYRYPLLLCAAEVGADPQRMWLSVAAFHHRQQQRARRHPAAMLTTSTHDTKRGEDARARIAALSELPDEWGRRVGRWNRMLRSRRSLVGGRRVPTGRDAYLLYQALIGCWPAEAVGAPPSRAALASLSDRMVAYAIKALREAKDATSWDRPDAEYEQAVERFVRELLDPDRSAHFLADFGAFQATVARLGMLNSLAQLVLRMTVPGVPDVYQGSELWDLSLVDPDNRQPVDFAHRAALLDEVAAGEPGPSWLESWQDGRIKLALLHRLLRLRAAHPAVFAEGDHRPVEVAGEHAEHVVAYQRVHHEVAVTVVVGRLFASVGDGERWPLGPVWGDTRLVETSACGADALTGAPADASEVGRILSRLPVAVVVSTAPGG